MTVTVIAAVEGYLDEEVVRRLVKEAGGELGPVYGRQGKPYLRDRIGNFNMAAQTANSLWFVLVDLDRDYICAPSLRQEWLPVPSRRLCLRVAVHAVEAWLMADCESFAAFLGIPESRVPRHPERLENPKRKIVDLARHSRKRFIREELVPDPQCGLQVGPGYTLRLREYVRDNWRPSVAAERAESLRRALLALQELLSQTELGARVG